MKKSKFILSLLIAATMIVSAAGCADNNGDDNKNDPPAHTQHVDADNDGKCDECGATVEKQPGGEDKPDEQQTYRVTFNLNYSGSPSSERQEVKNGFTATKPEDPEREGYGFTGWYTDKDCTTPYDFATPVTGNLVLFAGWSSDTIVVRFNYNYVGAPAITEKTVSKGSAVERPADPERTDYSFAGWYTDQACTKAYDFASPVSEALTLYAKWDQVNAHVTFDYNYEGSDEDVIQTVEIGTTVTAPEDPERVEYDFTGWYTDSSATVEYDFASKVEKDFTLYAGWELKTFTVTFEYNYGGAANTTQEVKYGATATEPENARPGYVCIWQLNGVEYDFSTPVTSDITLKAEWQEESSDTHTVTFYYNYNGAPSGGVYQTQTVQNMRTAVQPSAPERDGYYFYGWYTDAECTEEFRFTTRITSNTELYAKWLNSYTFEAEYVDLDGKAGFGFSVNLTGTDLIIKDNGTANASNGYYLTGLYYEGANIQFVINSDIETDNAIIVMRVQVEYDDKTFNPDIYCVDVNGESVDYPEFSLKAEEADQRSDDRRPFINVQLTGDVHLKKGENIITMTTTNNIVHGNTRQGDAPIIDCIYVYSDSVLTWNPRLDNLENKA